MTKKNQLWSFNIDNEYYTPDNVWNQILQYIPKGTKIYEPFYGNGRSGEYIRSQGWDVIHENEDCYLNYEKYEFDLVLSNPPYSSKKQVFNWLFKMDKPFVVLVPIATLTTSYLRDKLEQIKILVPRKRIHYYKEIDENGCEKLLKQTSFDTVWICYKCPFIKDTISNVIG